ncbi:MAG: DUF397 domain-containing protein [Dactylosporangium sp.]|nr:DUF397 domain-containing protein [Dactylosporangium sp.]NNJ63202.1 DUF397 domain-containing protein [Dactylosporangium sp.]
MYSNRTIDVNEHLASRAGWIRSSRCESSHCVEVATPASEHILMRDAKNPAGSHLAFGPTAWSAFLRELRAGGRER